MGVRQRDLIDGEEIVVEIRSSAKSLILPLLVLVVFAVVAVVGLERLPGPQRSIGIDLALALGALTAIWGGVRWLRWRSRVIAVTTERVLLVEGVVRRRTDQIRLARIVEVHLHQGGLARLFGRGAVIVELDDSPPVVIDGVRRPDALARWLLRSITQAADTSNQLGPLPVIVGDGDPTPPRGTPAVTAPGAAAALVRRDEIDRLEASGALSPLEAARRREQLGWAGRGR